MFHGYTTSPPMRVCATMLLTGEIQLAAVPNWSWLARSQLSNPYQFATRLTRGASLVEPELPTLSEHLGSPPVFDPCYSIFSFICMFCRSLFILLYFFSFGHCVVCSASIYAFWLPLWYLQTLLNATFNNISAISWNNPKHPDKTTGLPQVIEKLYHIILYTATWAQHQWW